jgi:predicted RNA-binding protein
MYGRPRSGGLPPYNPRMRDWAFITRPENWKVCEEKCVFGFDSEYRETISRYMKPDDRALVWVTLPIGGVAAAIRILKVSLDEEEHVGWTTAKGVAKLFQDRVYWEPIKFFSPALGPRSDMDFFNRLQFIPDKKRYNVYLQVALIRIAAEDVELALTR